MKYVQNKKIRDDVPKGVLQMECDKQAERLIADGSAIAVPAHELVARLSSCGQAEAIVIEAPPERSLKHRVPAERFADVTSLLALLQIPVVAESIRLVANGGKPVSADDATIK